jgi:O-antigen ligase
MAAGLATGRAIVSISIMVLSGAWLFDGLYRKDFKQKWKAFTAHRPALLITSMFFLYALSLIYSDGIVSGLKVLNTLFPLLFLPMIYASMPALTKRQVEHIAWIHIAFVLFSTLLSYTVASPELIASEPRNISLFVNHIRLSLLILMSMVLMYRFLWNKGNALRIGVVLASVWFLFFLWIIQSATGFAILLLLIVASCIFGLSRKGLARWSGIIGLLVVLGMTAWVMHSAADYFDREEVDVVNLETHTAQGNPYVHWPEYTLVENGHRLWLYVSMDEMKAAWAERSDMDPMEEDLKGQPLIGTLMRYLTSLGLRKDAEGVMALSEAQVREIEEGVTSGVPSTKNGLGKRLDVLFYEIDAYRNGHDPSLSSFTRRLEYWKAGLSLFSQHPVIGIGAGNVHEELDREYERSGVLAPSAWHLIHNQFITFLACFGIIGFLWMMYVHYSPLRLPSLRKEMVYVAFLLVLSASYLAEDTLNTQAGLSFFIFYQGLCVLAVYRPEERTSS